MKKWAFILVVIWLVGCTHQKVSPAKKVIQEVKDPIVEEVDAQIKQMTIEEKLGQMLFVEYRQPLMDTTLESLLQDVRPGGFILFSENLTTYEKSLQLIQEIKKRASIPLFIGIDQEGGNVQRLSYLQDMVVSRIPKMYDVGKQNSENLTASVAQVVAEELRVFGINLDFAPSIDIYSNPKNTVIGKRAFGSNSELVSAMGYAFGKGLEDNGVIPVYKHFPGHGDTSADSHYTLPIVYKDLPTLQSFELQPFQYVIDKDVDMIMVGHLAVPNVTGDNTPASLSKKMITDILKKEMGFTGLVITDAMNMQALRKNYTEEQIYQNALVAGVDIFLMPSNPREALRVMKECVDNGLVSMKQIDASAKKILTLKYQKIRDTYNEYLPSTYLNSEEHQVILKQVLA